MVILIGSLTDDQGKPVNGATLTAAAEQGPPVTADLADGTYALPLMAAGLYRLDAGAKGHAPASTEVTVRGGDSRMEGPPLMLPRHALIAGRVTRADDGSGVAGVTVRTSGTAALEGVTVDDGSFRIGELVPGDYGVTVEPPPGMETPAPSSVTTEAGQARDGVDFALVATPVVPTGPEVPTGPDVPTGPVGPPDPPMPTGPVVPSDPVPSGPAVEDYPLLSLLRTPSFSIDQPISEADAREAAVFFSVAALLFAGAGAVSVGNSRRRDVLGMLTLFYGAQDKSLQKQLSVSRAVWAEIDADLKILRDQLEELGEDIGFVEREARRQFNLGTNNEELGNTRFMQLFNRYVAIAADPLLRLDLRRELASPASDKTRAARAVALLVELKGVIVELVRTLGRYGTVATRQSNRDWSKVATRALTVLRRVGEGRLTDDQDDRNAYAALGAIIGWDRDRQIVPLVVLGRDGGAMLRIALEIYEDTKLALDDYGREAIIDLFQQPGHPAAYRTETLRARVANLRRYPLASWQ